MPVSTHVSSSAESINLCPVGDCPLKSFVYLILKNLPFATRVYYKGRIVPEWKRRRSRDVRVSNAKLRRTIDRRPLQPFALLVFHRAPSSHSQPIRRPSQRWPFCCPSCASTCTKEIQQLVPRSDDGGAFSLCPTILSVPCFVLPSFIPTPQQTPRPHCRPSVAQNYPPWPPVERFRRPVSIPFPFTLQRRSAVVRFRLRSISYVCRHWPKSGRHD
jgi:hypothetical protein